MKNRNETNQLGVCLLTSLLTAASFTIWECFHYSQESAANIIGLLLMTAIYSVFSGLFTVGGSLLLSFGVLKVIQLVYKNASGLIVGVIIGAILGALGGLIAAHINGPFIGTIVGAIIGIFSVGLVRVTNQPKKSDK